MNWTELKLTEWCIQRTKQWWMTRNCDNDRDNDKTILKNLSKSCKLWQRTELLNVINLSYDFTACHSMKPELKCPSKLILCTYAGYHRFVSRLDNSAQTHSITTTAAVAAKTSKRDNFSLFLHELFCGIGFVVILFWSKISFAQNTHTHSHSHTLRSLLLLPQRICSHPSHYTQKNRIQLCNESTRRKRLVDCGLPRNVAETDKHIRLFCIHRRISIHKSTRTKNRLYDARCLRVLYVIWMFKNTKIKQYA